ncbi:putative lipid II flippase FtsW [Halorhodospira halophila]|uniref:Probable peptidoglycan glycosyltransferase FtsW n=1 Tax=Halorhodospira halophila (strain DSM 244 / SL1) TaxID=349124 RepID=FTSW_HALHL|nr:putative lipid II flippase FtsW [Halorhodospira halophila]A1WYU4.1 RecName: Full=Probable peptidoglycan glycosyltransferase FtsW; Short=PGT; AltName: Full=Cell division protein FtsW; AltName: Full=Cell wall polymerase; AltName: Full=Peptidoglycan polymerase; Short=PG polymerase [Halorhodospira halophila SL1]ABM62856.1 cell division-specific peptidoglycan biosynthesis regulator FtsW [Halorhodospira halophila SL1]MBK1728021.1 putative lipid II flippase FtsW [Halorhodospira halophila]
MADLAAGVAERGPRLSLWSSLDQRLVWVVAATALLGLVMVASASISMAEQATGDPFYFFKRQIFFALLGLGMALALLQIPLATWERAGPGLLLGALALLVLVLIPGVGREVNGAVRWIPLGVFNLQVAEVVKVLLALYLAGFLVRRQQQLRTSMAAFLVPVLVSAACAFLLLLQPDFGTALMLMALAVGLLYLAGAPLWRFAALVGVLAAAAAALVVYSPYRWQRVTAFMDPWSDPFNTGFQLTQSLIAIGRGDWLGVGLGGSVQKLFYLPEAHTDFVFSVLAEELGWLGVLAVVLLFSYIVWRAMAVGWQCHRHRLPFAGYLAWAVGLALGLQAFINMGVATGLLPTKGLTLPLFSYGGSSALATGAMVGLLLRCGYELAQARAEGRRPEEAAS